MRRYPLWLMLGLLSGFLWGCNNYLYDIGARPLLEGNLAAGIIVPLVCTAVNDMSAAVSRRSACRLHDLSPFRGFSMCCGGSWRAARTTFLLSRHSLGRTDLCIGTLGALPRCRLYSCQSDPASSNNNAYGAWHCACGNGGSPHGGDAVRFCCSAASSGSCLRACCSILLGE